MTTSDALLAKIAAMACLGASSLVAGCAPFFVSDQFEREPGERWTRRVATAFQALMHFGSGVLFYTTFLHLMPDVHAGVRHLVDIGTLDRDAPATEVLAELIVCAGFFVVYVVEDLIHGLADRPPPRQRLPHHILQLQHYQRDDSGGDPNTRAHDVGDAVVHIVTVVGALSVHELFEGLAIGLTKTPDQVSGRQIRA